MSTNLKAILGGIVVIIVFGLAIWKFDTQKMVSDDKKAGNLTVVSWGGGYTKSQVEAYHKPWMAKGGMTKKKKGYAKGGAAMKKKGMAKGGMRKKGYAAGGMTVPQLRAAAKAKGYKIMKG